MSFKKIILSAILLTNFCAYSGEEKNKTVVAGSVAGLSVVAPLAYDYFTKKDNISNMWDVLPKNLLLGVTAAATIVNTANYFASTELKFPKMEQKGTFFSCAVVSVIGSILFGYVLKNGKFGFQQSTNKSLISGPAIAALGLNGFILLNAN